MKRVSVLMVCMGNICRSPAGEGVLQSLIAARPDIDWIDIDSAGTIGFHAGREADARMRVAAGKRNITLHSRARQVQVDDLHRFSLVLAMDRDNLADLQRLVPNPTAEVRLFSDFLDESWPTDVPDPYYGGEAGFDYVLDMLQAGCPRVLERLQELRTLTQP
jgi:protein-tyrosine phosphatase